MITVIWGTFIFLAIITVVMYLSKGGMRTPGLPNTKGLTSWIEKNQNSLFLLFGWTFLLLLPLFFGDKGAVEFSLRDWWWNHITTRVGIALIIGFTLYGWMMYADPKKPFRYKLGNWGTAILVLVSLFYLFGDKLPGVGTLTSGFSGFGSRSSSETSRGSRETGLGRAETQDIVTRFWYSNLPVIDAREMINIAQAESGFNHFDGNGNVLRGVENPDDIGVMQINQVFWGEKARELGYNINDLNGNLQMALYIRKEKGPSAWTTHKKVVETPEVVENLVAPVGDWSPVQKVKANCIWRVDRVVMVKDDQDRVHNFVPGQTLNVITWTFQISVPDEPPGNMELRCTPPQ